MYLFRLPLNRQRRQHHGKKIMPVLGKSDLAVSKSLIKGMQALKNERGSYCIELEIEDDGESEVLNISREMKLESTFSAYNKLFNLSKPTFVVTRLSFRSTKQLWTKNAVPSRNFVKLKEAQKLQAFPRVAVPVTSHLNLPYWGGRDLLAVLSTPQNK